MSMLHFNTWRRQQVIVACEEIVAADVQALFDLVDDVSCIACIACCLQHFTVDIEMIVWWQYWCDALWHLASPI